MNKSIVKRTLLKLCAEHKESCNDPDCDISLYTIIEVLNALDIELTAEEKKGLM